MESPVPERFCGPARFARQIQHLRGEAARGQEKGEVA
jgi:hypothetical protein